VEVARYPKLIITLIMVDPNGWPKPLDDPYEFNNLVFDDLWETLRSIINQEKKVHLIEDFYLNERNSAILLKPINLELECPRCASRWTT